MASKKTAKKSTKSTPVRTMSVEWDADKGPSDEQVEMACQILRADYWSSIRASAKCIVEAIDSGELASGEAVTDRIHEDADGSYWVIYTHANYRAILASDHDPFEDLADMGLDLDSAKSPASLAFCCVQADLVAQVNAECDGDVDARIATASERAGES